MYIHLEDILYQAINHNSFFCIIHALFNIENILLLLLLLLKKISLSYHVLNYKLMIFNLYIFVVVVA